MPTNEEIEQLDDPRQDHTLVYIKAAISETDPDQVALWDLGVAGYIADADTLRRIDHGSHVVLMLPFESRIVMEEMFRIMHNMSKGEPDDILPVIKGTA